MKNNRTITFILIVALTSIWGIIFYKIIFGVNAGESAEIQTEFARWNNSQSHHYEYKEDVRDPFQLVTPGLKKNIIKLVIANLTRTETPWLPPPFRLNGIVLNQKKKVAALEGNDGSMYFISEGDSINGLKIVQISEKRVEYQYSNKVNYWSID